MESDPAQQGPVDAPDAVLHSSPAPTSPRSPEAPAGDDAAAGRNLGKIFLGGLSWETNEDKIKDHFGKYGTIQEVTVMRDRVTGKPRGFGFITFDTEEAAQRACADAHTLDGRTIDAKPSVPQDSQQRPRSKKIFVGGLSPDTTPEQFKQYFERFGKVLEAQIMVDHNSNRSRGFGFITFEEEASVFRVFNAGPMHEVAGKRVEVKSATPKGSGPQGRGGGGGGVPGAPGAAGPAAATPEALAALGAAAMGGGAAGSGERFAQPFGPMGGYMAPGYMMPPGYGGFIPYHPAAAAFPFMGGYYSGYGPGSYPPAAAMYQMQSAYAAAQQQGQQSPGQAASQKAGQQQGAAAGGQQQRRQGAAGRGARGGPPGYSGVQLPREQSLPGAVSLPSSSSWPMQALQALPASPQRRQQQQAQPHDE